MPWSTDASYIAYLQSGELSDFTIQCNQVEFKVHKIVMVVQSGSPYFQRCIQGPFVESKDNKLVINDTEPEALAIIIAAIYLRDLPALLTMRSKFPKLSFSDRFPWLECLIEAYALADRFLLFHFKAVLTNEILKLTAVRMCGDEEKFCNTLTLIYETAQEHMSPLRARITAMCVANRDRKILQQGCRARKIVEEYDGQAWMVGLEVAGASGKGNTGSA